MAVTDTDPGTVPVPRFGAEAEFARFYDATYRTAFALAQRITADSLAACRVLEDAYAAAWQARTYTTSGPPHLGFLATVRNQALRNRVPAGSSDPPVLSYEEVNPLRRGLESTNEAGRRSLELVYFGGLSLPQAAEVLGVPLADVRLALRECLLTAGKSLNTPEEVSS